VTTQARDTRHHFSQVGRYTIFNQIAAGGAVMVHLARISGPAGFSRVVAVKRLRPQLAEDPELRAIFLEEARRISVVRHRHVVPTLDVVINDAEILQVMEHIQGATLGTLRNAAQRQQQEIPLAICSAVVAGALHGLHAAHEARGAPGESSPIIHRGVSPAQILVGIDGVPMMVGFGDARAVDARRDINPPLPGAPTYLAPEQIRGEPVTRATDIFAAAAVLWELFTTRALFVGVAEHERRYRLLQGADLTPPSTVAPRLPAGLDQVVMRGLRANPDQRYRTALEMAVAIEQAIPPASQSAVGAWVARTAVEALSQQTDLLKEIEVSHRGAGAFVSDELDDSDVRAHLIEAPGSEVAGAKSPHVVPRVRPAAPARRDRRSLQRALLIGALATAISAGVLAMSHRAMVFGALGLGPGPALPGGGSVTGGPIGTTVIIKSGGTATGAPPGDPAPGPVVQPLPAPDQAIPAYAPVATAPAPGPDPEPVLSRDTTVAAPDPGGSSDKSARERRLAPRVGPARATHKRVPAPTESAAVTPETNDDPARAPAPATDPSRSDGN
jgi:eukaryotic-like serine/threonine-protein kinase